MSIALYGHPFSSYTWKALIALYEKDLPFAFHSLDANVAEHSKNNARLAELWPLKKFPVMEDGRSVLIESSIVIEHLDLHYPITERLIPADPAKALRVRFMDRVFDNHVMDVMSVVVAEHIPFINPVPDPTRIERARTALSTIYGWLDEQLPRDGWACGEHFTLADCAGAPALFYADWVHPIPGELSRLKAYRAKVLSRPSVTRAVDEARPYRHYFPLGAPDQD